MEVRSISLAAPAREVFKMLKKHPGSILRVYKKSLHNSRFYYRLLDGQLNPVKNFPPWKVKQLINMDLLVRADRAEYKLKDGIELDERKNKKTT